MKRAIVATVLSMALLANGCSTAWIGKLDTILAAVAPSVINVLNIVALAEGKPVNAALVAKINADTANLKTVAADLAKATGSTATPCQATQAAVKVLGDDFTSVLQIVQVSSVASQTNALAVFEAADAIFVTITAIIPSCAVPLPAIQSHAVAKVQALDANTLVSNYNSVLTRATGKPLVDAYCRSHKLHAHSWAVRVVTMGHEK